MALRRKFSAGSFWDDVRRYQANAFCYIGELCRYLMNQPPRADDADNPVEKIIGNGLRPDIWRPFKARFGIDKVYEFYAASEGNIAFVNALNLDCTVGLCPAEYAIVEYDVERDQPVRDARGHLIAVPRGGVGLLVGEVSEKYAFDGYTDPAASERKLIRNAFADGDVWFDSGDLLRDQGFRHAQFVDRVGDTFRWKSENVSTHEVAEVLCGFPAIAEAAVYGVTVPGTEGRAGMAALVAPGGPAGFDFAALVRHLAAELPDYAWPRFLRFRQALEVTATLKQRKAHLKQEGFDLAQVGGDPLFLLPPGGATYVPLTAALTDDLAAGRLRF
jgi:acyl-CoA synthetase (AMP-forming)/AMP-acid ligase II